MLDDAANNRLLQSAWRCVQANNGTVYYVKHHIGNHDYRLLATDLRRVWYDSADAQQLYKKSSQHRLVLENDEQLSELLSHLGTFLESLDKCTIRESSSTRLLIECAELQGFARLTWTFMCQGLSGFEGATVLYDHFILPMLMMAENQPGKLLFFPPKLNNDSKTPN
ncbi:hypothetical protein BJV82DRAFT_242750 [Fennellomyces sp. T-0311]|nr:hypothetical protein BJV82DRAFT_242750 [Fennellomyces sp. T-0311]